MFQTFSKRQVSLELCFVLNALQGNVFNGPSYDEQKLAHSTKLDDFGIVVKKITFSLEAFFTGRYLCTSVPSVIRLRAAEAQ